MNAFILSTDTELRALVNRVCASRNPSISVLPVLPGMSHEPVPVSGVQSDLVILDSSSYPGNGLGMLERVSEMFPQAAIMLLSSDRSPEYLIAAMRTGVREVLALPLSVVDLDAALERFTHKYSATLQVEGRVMSFMSSKGGAGATFLAANLAHALSLLGQKRALLIDLNALFGDAALYVSDAKPSRTLSDVCQDAARLDGNLLESSVMKLSPQFSVLAASDQPETADEIRPEQIESVLQVARRMYDFVLIDVGRQINAVSIRALDQSDLICTVLQQTLPHLRDGRRLLDIFSSLGYRKEKIHLVLNRYDSSAQLSASEMERVLDQKFAFRIPNSYEVASESINQGTPVLQLARSSTISKALAEWVNRLVDANSPSRSSIIRRIFVRNPAKSELIR